MAALGVFLIVFLGRAFLKQFPSLSSSPKYRWGQPTGCLCSAGLGTVSAPPLFAWPLRHIMRLVRQCLLTLRACSSLGPKGCHEGRGAALVKLVRQPGE